MTVPVEIAFSRVPFPAGLGVPGDSSEEQPHDDHWLEEGLLRRRARRGRRDVADDEE
jgi:hypothetical protein